MGEILEIFDEHKKALGTAERREIHEKGFFHKCVLVLLFNSKGKLFLALRAKNKDFYPNVWSCCAEHKKPDETGQEACYRGMREELGIEEKIPLGFVGEIVIASNPNDRYFGYIYKTAFDGKITLKDREFQKGRFFETDEIEKNSKGKKEMFSPNFLTAWEYYLEKKGKMQ